LSVVTVPIGGVGLIGGITTAVKAVDDSVRIVSVQADSAATVPRSLKKGHPVENNIPETIADGIATGNVSELTLEIITDHVDEIITVSDTEIAQATLWLRERTKQLVKGAAASVAPLLTGSINCHGETIVPVLGEGTSTSQPFRTFSHEPSSIAGSSLLSTSGSTIDRECSERSPISSADRTRTFGVSVTIDPKRGSPSAKRTSLSG